jgi:hypothetical protein
MSELHDLLATATDRIESPRLEQAALTTARRRRTRRRGAAAAVVAAAVVVAVVVGTHLGAERTGGLPPAAPTQTPSPSVTTPPGSTATVWPRWDPREVDDLSAEPGRIAPAVPDVIDPPDSSPLLSDDPVEAAVLVVEEDGVAQVLGTDGDWRTVPLDGRYPMVSLSPDGTRLGIYYLYSGTEHDYKMTVHDLPTGESRSVQPPPAFEPWDYPDWTFVDEATLMLTSGPQTFVVQISSGEAEALTSVPLGLARTLDPAGNLLVSADFDQPNVLTDFAGGTAREASMNRTGRLSRIQADADVVVGTSYDGRPFNVVVADEANYRNWGLGPVAIADDGTVVLRVAAIGRQVDGFRLVAWEPTTGELSVVSATDLPIESSVVFAQGFLREVGPG